MTRRELIDELSAHDKSGARGRRFLLLARDGGKRAARAETAVSYV